jgi:hypothetical protein
MNTSRLLLTHPHKMDRHTHAHTSMREAHHNGVEVLRRRAEVAVWHDFLCVQSITIHTRECARSPS